MTTMPDLLLVDDDEIFCAVLARAFERRGYSVRVAHSTDNALTLAAAKRPDYAVVDLRMPGASGLKLVEAMHRMSATTRIVVLTGYASIATAVDAIKLGATHYLAKPADADQILAAFGESAQAHADDPEVRPLSVDRLEWEHIQRVLNENQGNISATARALNMHRRTLQRKLSKNPPRT